MKFLTALILCTAFALLPRLAWATVYYAGSTGGGGGGGGPSYDVAETFDAAGYDQSWLESGTGTINEDYATAPAPLHGSQSLRMSASSQAMKTVHTFSAGTEKWAYQLYNLDALPSANRIVGGFTESTGDLLLNISVTTTGTISVRTGTVSAATVGTLTPGTTYRFWYRYKAGTGANAEAEFAFADTSVTSKPLSGNNRVLITNGNSTSGAATDRIRVGAESGNVTISYIVDDVYVDDVDIAGVP